MSEYTSKPLHVSSIVLRVGICFSLLASVSCSGSKQTKQYVDLGSRRAPVENTMVQQKWSAPPPPPKALVPGYDVPAPRNGGPAPFMPYAQQNSYATASPSMGQLPPGFQPMPPTQAAMMMPVPNATMPMAPAPMPMMQPQSMPVQETEKLYKPKRRFLFGKDDQQVVPQQSHIATMAMQPIPMQPAYAKNQNPMMPMANTMPSDQGRRAPKLQYGESKLLPAQPVLRDQPDMPQFSPFGMSEPSQPLGLNTSSTDMPQPPAPMMNQPLESRPLSSQQGVRPFFYPNINGQMPTDFDKEVMPSRVVPSPLMHPMSEPMPAGMGGMPEQPPHAAGVSPVPLFMTTPDTSSTAPSLDSMITNPMPEPIHGSDPMSSPSMPIPGSGSVMMPMEPQPMMSEQPVPVMPESAPPSQPKQNFFRRLLGSTSKKETSSQAAGGDISMAPPPVIVSDSLQPPAYATNGAVDGANITMNEAEKGWNDMGGMPVNSSPIPMEASPYQAPSLVDIPPVPASIMPSTDSKASTVDALEVERKKLERARSAAYQAGPSLFATPSPTVPTPQPMLTQVTPTPAQPLSSSSESSLKLSLFPEANAPVKPILPQSEPPVSSSVPAPSPMPPIPQGNSKETLPWLEPQSSAAPALSPSNLATAPASLLTSGKPQTGSLLALPGVTTATLIGTKPETAKSKSHNDVVLVQNYQVSPDGQLVPYSMYDFSTTPSGNIDSTNPTTDGQARGSDPTHPYRDTHGNLVGGDPGSFYVREDSQKEEEEQKDLVSSYEQQPTQSQMRLQAYPTNNEATPYPGERSGNFAWDAYGAENK